MLVIFFYNAVVAATVVCLGWCSRISNCTTRYSRGGGFDARYLYESSKDVFREAPPVDMWWVVIVPYTPVFGTVPITDSVDHVTEKAVSWLHGTKDDVANLQYRMIGDWFPHRNIARSQPRSQRVPG